MMQVWGSALKATNPSALCLHPYCPRLSQHGIPLETLGYVGAVKGCLGSSTEFSKCCGSSTLELEDEDAIATNGSQAETQIQT